MGTLVEDKMRRFNGECAHFSFSKCHIYTHDVVQVSILALSHTKRITVHGPAIWKPSAYVVVPHRLLYLNLKLSSAKQHLTGFWRYNIFLGAEGRRMSKERVPLLLFYPLWYTPTPALSRPSTFSQLIHAQSQIIVKWAIFWWLAFALISSARKRGDVVGWGVATITTTLYNSRKCAVFRSRLKFAIVNGPEIWS
jgi:hypothetical protein